MSYFTRISIAIDALGQAFFRYGNIGVTISSRAGTADAHGKRWGCWLCKMLDRIDPNHCKKAIRNDRLRAHAVLKELGDPRVAAYLKRK